MRARITSVLCLIGAGLPPLAVVSALARDCPTAPSGKQGFVVERGDQQKTEVFHIDDSLVHTVTRLNGKTVLETVQYEGFFQVDRLDNGRRTKFEPQSELKKLFPLKPGQNAAATFTSESDGRKGQLQVQIAVKGVEELVIGACKYAALKIDRSESRNSAPPQFVDTEYYSPELKLILAKQYRSDNDHVQMIKYDRIYPLAH